MNSNVYIKSYSNGLKVQLSDTCSFNELVSEIEVKFAESKNFFKGSKIAVSFEGRKLSFEEEKQIIKIMEQTSEMTVLYVIGKDDETALNYAKVVDRSLCANASTPDKTFGNLYIGTLRSDERYETDEGVVVLGDIEPGATLIAAGNIVVIGGIYGSVQIKTYENLENYFIAASDISCEKIKIGDFRYHSKEKSKWLIRPKMNPKIAYYNGNQIYLENVSKETLTFLIGRMSK